MQQPANWNVLIEGGSDSEKHCAHPTPTRGYGRRATAGAEVTAQSPAPNMSICINLLSGFGFDALKGWAPLFWLPLAKRMERLRPRLSTR